MSYGTGHVFYDNQEEKMKVANYIISLIVCAVGVVFLVIGSQLNHISLDGVSTAASWGNILSWILIGLSIILALYNTFSENIPESKIDFKSYEFHNVLIVITALVAYVAAYYFLGCIITNAIFLPLFMIYLGERNWKVIVIYDAAALLTIWILFEKILGSPLAKAIWA